MFRKRIYILLISVVNMRIRRKIIIDMQPVVLTCVPKIEKRQG